MPAPGECRKNIYIRAFIKRLHMHTVTGNASEQFFEENNLDAFLLSAKEYGVEFVGDVRVNSWNKWDN